jgi:hypothetical protein
MAPGAIPLTAGTGGGSAIVKSFWLARLSRSCAVVETMARPACTICASALTFAVAY